MQRQHRQDEEHDERAELEDCRKKHRSAGAAQKNDRKKQGIRRTEEGTFGHEKRTAHHDQQQNQA